MKKDKLRHSRRRHRRGKPSHYLQNRYRNAQKTPSSDKESLLYVMKRALSSTGLENLLKGRQFILGALFLVTLSTLLWVVGTVFVPNTGKVGDHKASQTSLRPDKESSPSEGLKEIKEAKVKPTEKSLEAKEAVVAEDLSYMYSLSLYYDYAHLSLEDTIKAFLAEQGLEVSQVAFSYKNLVTNETFSMNDTQLMTAGSTYKLPLGMLIIDEVEAGHIDMAEEVNYTTIDNITDAPDYPLYLEGFGETMNWTQILDNALIHSENTPAYVMADRLGGFQEAYQKISKFGQSKGVVKTIDYDGGNKTTSNYYIQVLDYLWKHKEKYAPIIDRLDASFTDQWYEQYVHSVRISQKPGFSQEALNINAIVEEEVPYLISVYTAGFGGSSEATIDMSGYGYDQLCCLSYVINEWHRVNMNPAKESPSTEETTENS